MPGKPATGLIFPHTTLVFCILEWTLHPVPLCLHKGKPFGRDVTGSITQTIFSFRLRVDFTSYHQMPFPGLSLLTIPNPDISMQDIYTEFSFGTITNLYAFTASGDCLSIHLSTRIALVWALSLVGFFPRFDCGGGIIGLGSSKYIR